MRRARETHASQPLKRKPKTLTEEPTVFEASAGSGGMVLRASSSGKQGTGKRAPASATGGFTNDPAEQAVLAEQVDAEPEVKRRARQIASSLSVPRPRTENQAKRGHGRLASLPYQGGADDIDLDATLESLSENPVPDDEDIIVRDRAQTQRSVVLLVDVSGSSKGERILTNAAIVGALASELGREQLAVIAFWSDAAVLTDFDQAVRPQELLEQVMRIPARGLTNVDFPLQLAVDRLATEPQATARAILFSDCVHNAGPDPRVIAAQLPRLDLLIDASGENDVDLGQQLADAGHGMACLVRDHRQVSRAISSIFRNARGAAIS